MSPLINIFHPDTSRGFTPTTRVPALLNKWQSERSEES